MMNGNKTLVILGIVIVMGLFVAGCTQPSTAPATAPTTAPAVQPSMANPASVNCGKLNGTTEIKKNPDGSEYGMCTFANGTSCEEWALFNGKGCTSGAAVANATPSETPLPKLANPASVNCGKLNGTTEIKTNPDGSEYGMCTFANGTSCEEFGLLYGEGCLPGGSNATAPAK